VRILQGRPPEVSVSMATLLLVSWQDWPQGEANVISQIRVSTVPLAFGRSTRAQLEVARQ
jgi:hypothetical protein